MREGACEARAPGTVHWSKSGMDGAAAGLQDGTAFALGTLGRACCKVVRGVDNHFGLVMRCPV